MAHDIEFHFEVAPDASEVEDELAGPSRQLPPRAWLAIGLAGVLILVGIGLAGQHHPSHAASASASASVSAAETASPTSVTVTLPTGDPAEALEAEILALAVNGTLPAQPGGPRRNCPVPPLGTSPEQTLATTVQEALPDFVSEGSQVVLGPGNAGLCMLETRFRSVQGAQLIVLVRSPPADGTPNVLETIPDPVLTASSFTSAAGWRIDAGVLGVPVSVPDLSVLTALTASPELTW